MKLLSIILSILISNTYAADIAEVCEKQIGGKVISESKSLQLVGSNCLADDYFTVASEATDMSKVKEFLALEKQVGQAVYDLGHVDQMKFYRIARGYNLSYSGISYPTLKDFGYFGINSLGVYDVAHVYDGYWDLLDVIKGAKQMDAASLGKFFKSLFSNVDVASDDYFNSQEVEAIKDELAKKNTLYPEALSTIVNLLTNNSQRSVTVYPLLDNNNENVQDAQWVVVGSNFVVLINRFWYL